MTNTFMYHLSGNGLIVDGEVVVLTLSSGHKLTGEIVSSTPQLVRVLRTDVGGEPQTHRITGEPIEALVNPDHIACITVQAPAL